VYQNISALAPKEKEDKKELTVDEKNIRWALNKYYYTRHKNTLNTVYTLLLKEKYCDKNGVLQEHYPSFYQFRYFYRQHRKMQNYYIARNGIKNYQRNNRPLLGDGVQSFAASVGYALEHKYVPPQNFYGIGGMKIFRDLIWQMQGMMKADHKFYKSHGQYDFPQKKWPRMLAMYAVGAMIGNPKIKAKMGNAMNEGMLMPYKKILDKIDKNANK
jgi:hypothetical protein